MMVGQWGEQLAAQYLTQQGLTIIQKNVHTPYGEVDIIAREEDMTVFVEVKARSGDGFGLPEEAVNSKKMSHLVDAAEAFMQEHPELPGAWRIDIIAIRGKPGDLSPEIIWFENAIS